VSVLVASANWVLLLWEGGGLTLMLMGTRKEYVNSVDIMH